MSESKRKKEATNGITLWGYVTDEDLAKGNAGLPNPLPENSIVAFNSYAPFDIPIGTKFTRGMLLDTPSVQVRFEAKLIAVAIFGQAVSEIPHGHKAAIALQFPNIPNQLTQLLSPVSLPRPDFSKQVAICTEEKWEQLKAEFL